jgi:acyl-[acyl-carrier-protein]-phospholipid O-acyltransferase / long-chain-fatty-acid--[acyl-carrier-protein] ligase
MPGIDRPPTDIVSAPASPERWRHGFWALMATQFQGAFADNTLKQLVIFLVMARHLPKAELDKIVSDAGIYFAIPFLLFSAYGGWMADRFSKAGVMRAVKIAEIAIMAFATVALATGRLPLQLAGICLMGVHSAFFSSSKYGSLPEIVPLPKLSWANGIIEMLTFLAAILGTLSAGLLATYFQASPAWPGIILTGLAVAGYCTSLGITRIPAAAPGKRFQVNFLDNLWSEFRWMQTDRDLWRANLGNTLFFFLAALVQMNLLLYADHILKVNPLENSTLNVALAIGIGAGSLLAGKLSHDKVEYGLIPLGAFLLTAMSLILGWPGVPKAWFIAALTFLGVGGGLFIVPLAAVLQHRPPPERKGAVQGAASWLSWIGIIAASILQKELSVTLGWSPGQIFWLCGAVALISGIYITLTRPSALAQMLARWSASGHPGR